MDLSVEAAFERLTGTDLPPELLERLDDLGEPLQDACAFLVDRCTFKLKFRHLEHEAEEGEVDEEDEEDEDSESEGQNSKQRSGWTQMTMSKFLAQPTQRSAVPYKAPADKGKAPADEGKSMPTEMDDERDEIAGSLKVFCPKLAEAFIDANRGKISKREVRRFADLLRAVETETRRKMVLQMESSSSEDSDDEFNSEDEQEVQDELDAEMNDLVDYAAEMREAQQKKGTVKAYMEELAKKKTRTPSDAEGSACKRQKTGCD